MAQQPVNSTLQRRAKAANLDAIHDTVHEMARDEARHGKAFEGLVKEILWLSYKPCNQLIITPCKFTCKGVYYLLIIRRQPSMK